MIVVNGRTYVQVYHGYGVKIFSPTNRSDATYCDDGTHKVLFSQTGATVDLHTGQVRKSSNRDEFIVLLPEVAIEPFIRQSMLATS